MNNYFYQDFNLVIQFQQNIQRVFISLLKIIQIHPLNYITIYIPHTYIIQMIFHKWQK